MDEFALIRKHFQGLTTAPEDVVLGIGDDCAVLRPAPGEELAVTTDTLVAGRHFDPAARAEDIGWKSLAVSLSDLAAMGARPRWFVLGLTLPQADSAWLERFAQGLKAAADKHGIALVGGDTTAGPLSITITALGTLPAGKALRRSCAKPGDLVCVTGTLGDAALALQLGLATQCARFDADREFLKARLNRPAPRVDAGHRLRGLAHAAIDLSDGLAGDLQHILEESWVGAEIEADKLPRSEAFQRLAPDASRLALQASGGDDYELCVCIPPEALAEARRRLDLPLTEIGRIRREPGLRWLDARGELLGVDLRGYNHFAEASPAP
ncbi:MAG TPA: thiamine-phosphate kinase [Nevskia sp.]|nr:thiamine-phosphate kinase [Nevskia sp.]